MTIMKDIFNAWHTWILFGGSLLALWIVVSVGHAIFFKISFRFSDGEPRHSILSALRKPVFFLLNLFATLMLLPASPLPAGVRESLERALDLGLIGCAAWTLVVLIDQIENRLTDKYRIDVENNLLARRIRTRLQVFHHISLAFVIVLALAVALMTFPNVRSLGASLLASAGLAGLIAGMAARPALTNLIAGLQIAITEPIRLEDVVIVENEWGWIEEIHSTYVVVRIWDLRRMILPLSYFIEHPFQNWTRHTADILGNVLIYVDYRMPIEPLRLELRRILVASPLWKGQVCALQVTDASEKTIQIRALMDASDSGKCWDLRCEVREKLIAFIQANYPDALPRNRSEWAGAPNPLKAVLSNETPSPIKETL